MAENIITCTDSEKKIPITLITYDFPRYKKQQHSEKQEFDWGGGIIIHLFKALGLKL